MSEKFGVGNIEPPPPGPSLPRLAHVWVRDNVVGGERLAGLMLAVRRTAPPHRAGQWECYIAYGRQGIAAHGGETDLHVEWIEASRIQLVC